MNNPRDFISTSLSVVTGTYALSNIQDMLSIIILILSIANILYNLGYKIYNHIKNKRFDMIDDDIENAKNELTDLKEDDKQ